MSKPEGMVRVGWAVFWIGQKGSLSIQTNSTGYRRDDAIEAFNRIRSWPTVRYDKLRRDGRVMCLPTYGHTHLPPKGVTDADDQ